MIGRRAKWLLPAVIACTMAVILFAGHRQKAHQQAELLAKLQQIVRIGNEPELSCREIVTEQPLVLLALGQSNAANHGAGVKPGAHAITLVVEGKCVTATDPLPGATGRGGSIWQRLPDALRERVHGKPIVLSVLAVDASSIAEWTSQDSALRQRLLEQLATLRQLGLPPNFVLWQQGESDARLATSGRDYSRQLDALAATISEAGIAAPIILARSTICRSAPAEEIRRAIESKAANDQRFRLGPDTDLLSGEGFRHDGCHLSIDGLTSAARMWAAAISDHAYKTSAPP